MYGTEVTTLNNYVSSLRSVNVETIVIVLTVKCTTIDSNYRISCSIYCISGIASGSGNVESDELVKLYLSHIGEIRRNRIAIYL